MEHRPALAALCDAVGVLPVYHDVSGREHRLAATGAETLLAAMGLAVRTEEDAQAALDRLRAEAAGRALAPVTVLPVEPGADPVLRIPSGEQGPFRWQVHVEHESGRRSTFEGEAEGEVLVALTGVAAGYHLATLTLSSGGIERSERTSLIVTPTRCWTAADALRGRRAYGIWTNLYSVRSAQNWGVGDFADLRRLVQMAAAAGAAFVGVNPLHAVRNRGDEISPYSPVSRLFRSVLYLSVPEVPELADSADARRLLATPEFEAELAAVRTATQIDHDRIRRLKERVLRLLYREFRTRHRGRDTLRGRAFEAYVAREGRALDEYATFLSLEHHLATGDTPVYWRDWPEEFRAPEGEAVHRFRDVHADELEWHRWLQFELDRQLGLAADTARTAGMAIGLYQDLAVGSSDGGSDVWAFQQLFDRGVTVGAPPDDYAAEGQDWGLPPVDPNQLRRSGYRYWSRLLRSAFRHAGALRIDHAMGLTRLYWIPPGQAATEGAYVRYPAEELLAVLALESHRARAVVIAEDLGTVPEGFEALLERWGILSSRVLWFEREDNGGFRPQSAYAERALVTTTTHDHSPLAAWLDGADLELRRRIGVITDEEAESSIRWRRHEREALLRRLDEAGLLGAGSNPPYGELLAAVYGYVAGTPARLVGVSLDDLAGEMEPVNIPGVGHDRYPAWTRRMTRSLEELEGDPAVRRTLDMVRRAAAD